MEISRKRVVVGLSGGVDSSVALYALKKSGYEAIGVFLKYDVWRDSANPARENVCCSRRTRRIAEGVCRRLKVPFVVLDAAAEFNKEVVEYFVSELRSGRTPSPCIFCNPRVKFRALLDYADRIGAEHVATGHYARSREGRDGMFELSRCADKKKDQTYSLSFLTQKELSRTLFPLGELKKDEVYGIAGGLRGFEVFGEQDQSQDFCFVARRAYGAFLSREVGIKGGRIVDEGGRVLGAHKGLHFYTIGQRRGIRLAGGPYYVVGKNISKGELIVSTDSDKSARREVVLSPINLISPDKPKVGERVSAKTRSTQKEVGATVSRLKKGGRGQAVLSLDKPLKALTPGQVAVFYDGEVCLGGGVIAS